MNGTPWGNSVQIYSSNKQKELISIDDIKSVCITPNHELEILGKKSQTIVINRLSNHEEISKIDIRETPIWMECFSDSRRLVVLGSESVMCIDLYTLQTLFTLKANIPHWSQLQILDN
jgi:cyanophycinase-like exopeptidase